MILHLRDGELSDQPSWWLNFIKDIDRRYGYNSTFLYRTDEYYERCVIIHDEISKVGAKSILEVPQDSGSDLGSCGPQDPGAIIAIDFDSDELATWFLLKWS